MKKRIIERTMFYNASREIFCRAEKLRNNMTDTEKILWERLRKKQYAIALGPFRDTGLRG